MMVSSRVTAYRLVAHLVDAPIPVRKSSGGEPLAVVVGQGVVALVSAFEPGDGDQGDAEMSGDGG